MFCGVPTANSERFIMAAEAAGIKIIRFSGKGDSGDPITAPETVPVIISGDDMARRFLKDAEGLTSPVIVIPESDKTDIAALLDAGADDVIRPPFSGEEIFSRIKAIFRRLTGAPARKEVVLGDLRIPLNGGEITLSGTPVRTSATETEILGILAANHPRKISRDTLYDTLYALAEDPPQSKVIDVHICNLRKKLMKADTMRRNFIRSTSGIGYGLEVA